MKANIELFKFTVSDITLFHKPTSCEEAVTCIVSCFRWWLAVVFYSSYITFDFICSLHVIIIIWCHCICICTIHRVVFIGQKTIKSKVFQLFWRQRKIIERFSSFCESYAIWECVITSIEGVVISTSSIRQYSPKYLLEILFSWILFVDIFQINHVLS